MAPSNIYAKFHNSDDVKNINSLEQSAAEISSNDLEITNGLHVFDINIHAELDRNAYEAIADLQSNEDTNKIENIKQKISGLNLPDLNIDKYINDLISPYTDPDLLRSGNFTEGIQTSNHLNRFLTVDQASNKQKADIQNKKIKIYIKDNSQTPEYFIDTDHFGIDLIYQHNIDNPKLYATQDGIVYNYDENTVNGLGKFVILRHTYKDNSGKDHILPLATVYAHLDSFNVGNDKQQISKGTLIGIQGKTGGNYSSHLHLELWYLENNNSQITPVIRKTTNPGISLNYKEINSNFKKMKREFGNFTLKDNTSTNIEESYIPAIRYFKNTDLDYVNSFLKYFLKFGYTQDSFKINTSQFAIFDYRSARKIFKNTNKQIFKVVYDIILNKKSTGTKLKQLDLSKFLDESKNLLDSNPGIETLDIRFDNAQKDLFKFAFPIRINFLSAFFQGKKNENTLKDFYETAYSNNSDLHLIFNISKLPFMYDIIYNKEEKSFSFVSGIMEDFEKNILNTPEYFFNIFFDNYSNPNENLETIKNLIEGEGYDLKYTFSNKDNYIKYKIKAITEKEKIKENNKEVEKYFLNLIFTPDVSKLNVDDQSEASPINSFSFATFKNNLNDLRLNNTILYKPFDLNAYSFFPFISCAFDNFCTYVSKETDSNGTTKEKYLPTSLVYQLTGQKNPVFKFPDDNVLIDLINSIRIENVSSHFDQSDAQNNTISMNLFLQLNGLELEKDLNQHKAFIRFPDVTSPFFEITNCTKYLPKEIYFNPVRPVSLNHDAVLVPNSEDLPIFNYKISKIYRKSLLNDSDIDSNIVIDKNSKKDDGMFQFKIDLISLYKDIIFNMLNIELFNIK